MSQSLMADKTRAVSTISHCQNISGGFGGGPSQLAHLATTYAAVNALAIVGTKEAYDVVDRASLLSFFIRLKQPDGSFLMHDGGEADARGTYCIASCARLLNLPTAQLFSSSPEFVVRCQSYEGGLSGYPGVEAHGGYTFCALAAMEIMQKTDLVDLDALANWITNRQMSFEGGFSGRTNKLVDGCYSFWQGGSMPILEVALTRRARKSEFNARPVEIFNRESLQEYILICCQSGVGGLRDKPSSLADYYHSCYCLSGLSVAQHYYEWDVEKQDIVLSSKDPFLLGSADNLVRPSHPLHNIRPEHVDNIRAYFEHGVEVDPGEST
ncbi:hypothetical protein HK097_002173 [Rhizophlyctis rosea]|uniref:Protein farnesyltransferase subunit beta n=1 Tax=Rhizophlyctis rosea TaxID=64517 RepID=A0AAD5SIM9_9FUNG|nr:hypothetical protein HK097_002173 [Rhizophlyctis rosea]